jgi:hypothetical protein
MGILKIDEELHEELRKRAKQDGITLGNTIRQCVGLPLLPEKPRGRPVDLESPLNRARRSGDKTYTGAPCVRCGCTERRTVNGGCVNCFKASTRFRKVPGEPADFHIMRQQVYEQGETNRYVSPVSCPDCGGYERHLKSGKCFNCWSGDGVRIR